MPDHPWSNFIEARLAAIKWLQEEMGYNDEQIRHSINVDPVQVTLLKMTAANLPAGGK